MLPDFDFSAHHAEGVAPRAGLICARESVQGMISPAGARTPRDGSGPRAITRIMCGA
jgi:hypothetical protein